MFAGTWELTFEGLDEEPKTLGFQSLEAAIDHAVVWFAVGYDPDGNDTIDSVPSGVADDVVQLIEDLRAGREFFCGRFYEKVSVKGPLTTPLAASCNPVP